MSHNDTGTLQKILTMSEIITKSHHSESGNVAQSRLFNVSVDLEFSNGVRRVYER